MAAKKSFLLRLAPDLWEELNCWARDELRSVNAQIEYILRQAVRRRKRKSEDDQEPGEGAKDKTQRAG